MYLKALEIQGFKSFPDKVRLSFEKDVTAIVGPNGSGKSNISDAISWVLGEQRTKTLRGSKMEDVIFGGTPERAKLGFAQVSLILDNDGAVFDAEPGELTVTRRYYRSGESEYFINKRSVRLKDVNALFMDTGLGRDGYSMIGQGRVDEILSAKSTDRREVFEEAAGISRFRYRREEAQNKLDKTEDSLLRLNDKISELELSVEPLRRQAEVAKKYLTLRDELRGLEISLWMEQLDRLGQRTALLRQEAAEATALLEKAREELQSLYDNAESFTAALREGEEKAEKLRSEIEAVSALAAEKENELAVLTANLESGEANAERLRQELREQSERDSGLKEQIAQRKARAGELDEAIAALVERCGALIDAADEAERAAREREEELASTQAQIQAAAGAASAARARYEALSSTGAEAQSRTEAAREELGRFEERLETERAAFAEAEERLEVLRREAEAQTNRIAGLRLRAKNRAGAAEELREKRRQLQLESNRVNARAGLLSDMKKEYEGFSRAVRSVMQEKRSGGLRNIHGTVAELIKVPDEYAVAIETALGESLQHIVVDREEDGKAAIQYLKRRDLGRATFQPLSAVRGNELTERELLTAPGVIGLASRLISCEARYEGVVKSLLGRVVVAEDLDRAIAASRQSRVRAKIVTLDGQVLNAAGSMTGGSAARSVGMLSRTNELERLQRRQRELTEEDRALAEKLSQAEREKAAADYDSETAEGDLRRAQDELVKLSAELEQRRVLLRSLEETRETMAGSLGEAEDRAGRNENEKETARERAEELAARERELRELAESLSRKRDEARAEEARLTAELAGAKNEEAGLKSEREATLRSVGEWESLLSALGGERGQKEKQLEALETEKQSLLAERQRKQGELDGIRETEAAGRARLSEALREKAQVEERRSGNEKKTQEKNAELVELEKNAARLEQRQQAADMEEKQLVDKLWDSYELSRAAAQRQRQELESVSKATKRVSALKREIGALGTPNIGAIEEFQRVNERYSYLTDQRDDILEAKAGLEKIIRDVTREMEEIFRREFMAINEHFKETFRELFGGGSASLELENEEDILSSGIEIKVQPPGKTQRTLTLLSGGERAFVAIAIYFAILKVRPTPFCVLDEIESALDEKNVTRFADYLRKVCHKTQFLVITHRRGSMERADVLYGVTMQSGVSKVLSIDLDEALKKY